jgi:SNF2 family DNA or RNA helicase
MAEDQALDRVHRMGQKNNVVTTRYIVANSIDEVPAICVCFLYI